MKYLLPLLFITGLHTCLYAQKEITFPFTSEDDNRLISETDSGKYYVADGDTTNIVFINDDGTSCRVMNGEHHIICMGDLSGSQDQYLQEGKWVEYYPDGKIKSTGYYYQGKPMGLWQHYYSNGRLKSEYSYAVVSENENNSSCLNGVYKEYYKSGALKTLGFYKANMDGTTNDTIIVKDPMTGDNKMVVQKTKVAHAEKIGSWVSYPENGTAAPKENEATPEKDDSATLQKEDSTTPQKDDDDDN